MSTGTVELLMVVPVPATASRAEMFRIADEAARRAADSSAGVAQPVAWRLGWDRAAGRVASGWLRIVPLPTVESVLAELRARGIAIPMLGPEETRPHRGPRLVPGGTCRRRGHVLTAESIGVRRDGAQFCRPCVDLKRAETRRRRAGGAR